MSLTHISLKLFNGQLGHLTYVQATRVGLVILEDFSTTFGAACRLSCS